jgi:hypothetical protein
MATAQNTLSMMPGDITKSLSIKPSLIEELAECARKTGRPISRILDRAINNFLEDEAPILMQSAEKCRRQRV